MAGNDETDAGKSSPDKMDAIKTPGLDVEDQGVDEGSSETKPTELSQSTEDVIALFASQADAAADEGGTERASEEKAGSVPKDSKNDRAERSNEEPTDSKATDQTDTKRPKNDDDDDDAEKKKRSASESPSKTAVPPQKPIKRARTAYFIFAEDERPAIQAEHPGEGVATIAKVLGQKWAALGREEKEKYQRRAAEERARVAERVAAWKAANGDKDLDDSIELKSNFDIATSPLTLPMQKVRKICKLDPDVRNVSKEACLLIAKCAERVLAKLGQESVTVAQLQNRRKLRPDDVAEVCSTRERFGFLQDDIRDLLVLQQRESSSEVGNAKEISAATVKAAAGSKPLTDYFSAAPKKGT